MVRFFYRILKKHYLCLVNAAHFLAILNFHTNKKSLMSLLPLCKSALRILVRGNVAGGHEILR